MNCVLDVSSFDISIWNTNNVSNINGIFARCSLLISVFDFS